MTSDVSSIDLGTPSRALVDAFCRVAGDANPIHCEVSVAYGLGFPDVVVPGSLLATLVLLRLDALEHSPVSVAFRFKRWAFAGERLEMDCANDRIRVRAADGRVCVVARIKPLSRPVPESNGHVKGAIWT